MKNICLFIALTIATLGCASRKGQAPQLSSRAEAIRVAIQDFATTKLFKQDSVFYVSFTDTAYRLALIKLDNNSYTHIKKRLYPDIINVNIIGSSETAFIFNERSEAVTKVRSLSRFIEINGKLFYWYDHNYLMSEEALTIFIKHGVIQINKDSKDEFPDMLNDDRKKAASYYICRNSPLKFKRIISGRAAGYYDPPKIKCATN